jgi:ATP-binding cassette subfamily B protein
LWLFQMLAGTGKREAAGTIAVAVIGGLGPFASLTALRALVDALPKTTAGSSVFLMWTAVFAGATLIEHLCVLARDHIGTAVLDSLRTRLQRRLLVAATRIPPARYEDSVLRDRLRFAGQTLGDEMTGLLHMIPSLVTTWVGVASMAAFVAATSPLAFLCILAGAVVDAFVNALVQVREFSTRKQGSEAERCDDEIQTLLIERRHAAEIQLYGLAGLLVRLANRFNALAAQRLIDWQKTSMWLASLGTLAGAVGLGGACFVLVRQMSGGELSIGQISASVYCLLNLSQAMGSAFVQTAVLKKIALGAEDLRAFFNEAETYGEERHVECGKFESVRLENVGFTYHGASRPSLHDVDCTIRRGERIAVVGPNGAGKTTLAKVILGLFNPTVGERSLERGEEDAPTLGCAFQDFLKFQTTVRDNVALGDVRRPSNDEALKTAATGTDFVDALADGWDTKLGTEFWEDGTDLSIGQWQRLALARTFFRDADVAVLDEPSAALDPRAELELIRLFRETERDKTMIMISHRLGCTRFADRVICVVDGTIAEEGTHEELMRLKGVYASMYQAQRSWYEA